MVPVEKRLLDNTLAPNGEASTALAVATSSAMLNPKELSPLRAQYWTLG
jgi:hypothetical protein